MCVRYGITPVYQCLTCLKLKVVVGSPVDDRKANQLSCDHISSLVVNSCLPLCAPLQSTTGLNFSPVIQIVFIYLFLSKYIYTQKKNEDPRADRRRNTHPHCVVR